VLPFRDNVPTRAIPFFNYVLVFANVRVFIHELSLTDKQLTAFILRYGLRPSLWAHPGSPHASLLDKLSPLVTSMFLHGSWMHIISNLWFLLLFGRGVEDRLGHARYLLLYFAGGVASGALQLATHWGSALPTIGASGAIAGVMGAYFLLFPFARITTLVPVFILPLFVDIPALFFLGLWFATQIYSGVYAYSLGADFGGIAWWGHIGGFVAGMYLAGRFGGASRRNARYGW